MYAEFATDLVEDQRADGVATTSVVARTLLADECVDFLRSGVNAAIAAAFAVVGSLAMLFFYDPLLGLVAAAVAVPVALINRRLMRRSAGIYRALNDQSEREVSLIDAGSVKDVRRHFGVIAGHWNRLVVAQGRPAPFLRVHRSGRMPEGKPRSRRDAGPGPRRPSGADTTRSRNHMTRLPSTYDPSSAGLAARRPEGTDGNPVTLEPPPATVGQRNEIPAGNLGHRSAVRPPRVAAPGR